MIEEVMPLTFDEWTAITTTPTFIITVLLIWAIPLIVFLLVASVRKGRSSNGKVLSKPMIFSANIWIPFMIWIFLQGLLFVLLILFMVPEETLNL